MPESLILVDPYGRRAGVAERQLCHQGSGMRHLAFVIFVIAGDGRILLQKRSASKLGGGRWDVSATSHVRAEESYFAAMRRCLAHELGIRQAAEPRYQLSYLYHDQLGDQAEHEHCSLFLADYDGSIEANSEEVDDLCWIDASELQEWHARESGQFTRWFSEAFRRLLQRY